MSASSHRAHCLIAHQSATARLYRIFMGMLARFGRVLADVVAEQEAEWNEAVGQVRLA